MSFTGRLTGRPYGGKATLASLRGFPLSSESDYRNASGFRGIRGIPVYLNFFEHFDLMSHMVKLVLKEMEELDFILVEIAMPSGARLTPTLLHEKVFLCLDVNSEFEKLRDRSFSVLAIRDSFIRHPQEMGDNSINVDCFAKSSTLHVFHQFIQMLSQWRIEILQTNFDPTGDVSN